MTDERREVHRRPSLLDRRQRLADVKRRRTAVARDDGRDSHADEVVGARLLDEVVGVRMHVDEAGCDDETGGVDDVARVELRERADLDDASGPDRHVGPPRGSTGAVDDLSAGNQQVIARLDLASRRLPKHADEKKGARQASGNKSSNHHPTATESTPPPPDHPTEDRG